ncbi:restriction endonuclease subunit S [Shewanella sp. SM32]|uniref:restriction endonuclease subunit S n=1 Tax=Shewanella sp. SM32 TaxID=2912796 RepID=UPI0021D832C0|nr:restriction endonuclease subunit S [Shewanella sp. SM32]MCU8070485.1 restriction endonuclease subunit S [Shewanella sp. SM32]
MSDKYVAYPEYKNSCVDWVGPIPLDWDMWKLAHAYQSIGSGTTPPSNEDEWYGDGVPWVTTGELRENLVASTSKNVTREAISKFSALKVYPKGSLIMAMYGATIGRLGLLDIEATTNQACCVLTKSATLDNKYVFYWLRAFRDEIIGLSSGGGQPNINQEKVSSLKISAPELKLQQSVVAFLDYETARIDQLIAKQQRLIELLKEKRQAVISHAVTKGLNPNVPMKDSGVEWLGQVPEHWTVSRVKYVSSVSGGFAFSSDDFVDSGIQLIKIGNLYQSRLQLERDPTFLPIGFSKSHAVFKVSKGDLLMSLTGTLGKRDYGFAVRYDADEDSLLNQRVAKFNLNQSKINPDFMLLLLLSDSYLSQIYSMPSGTKQANLSNSDVLSPLICYPSQLNEQESIVKHVYDSVSKIDLLTSKAIQAIDFMNERRYSLISAAVTGKIDLRNWERPNA